MTTLGVGLLLAALALLSIFRAKRDGTSHPAVSSQLCQRFSRPSSLV